MTGKADYSEQEWHLISEGPPTAGMIVITAQRGGTIRETFAMAKAYTEARKQHGQSQLLDDIVASKPEIDHTHYHSPEELRDNGLQHLRDATALLGQKASPDEVGEYGKFVLALVERVAHAHREGGTEVSDAEQKAIDEVTSALGVTQQ